MRLRSIGWAVLVRARVEDCLAIAGGAELSEGSIFIFIYNLFFETSQQ